MYAIDEVIDGRYRVLEELGSGGYGTVFLAEELGVERRLPLEQLGGEHASEDAAQSVLRRVAVKVLHGLGGSSKRFLDEVGALCRLQHPGIVTVYHHGCERYPYVVMELVDGIPLGRALEERTPSALARIRWMIGIAEALAHAHERAVLHRDLKPDNILITEDGLPKIVDFGLAASVADDRPLTQRVGTPGYLAPELLDDDVGPTDHRVDIYAFGATLYRVFAGHSPFDGDGIMATVRRQLEGDFAFPEDFPDPLRSLVARCLAVDPVERPRCASEVADELRRVALRDAGVVGSGGGNAPLHDVSSTERVDLLDVVVRGVESFEHPQRGPGVRFAAAIGDLDQHEETGVFAWSGRSASRARRVHDTLASLWPGAELSLFGLGVVERSDGARFLLADAETVPVIEPRQPVSVTDAAKVEGVRAGPCATRYLLSLRTPMRWSMPLVLGSLAHTILEDLVTAQRVGDEVPVFDDLFDACVRGVRWDALAAGMTTEQLEGLRETLRDHFVEIERWTREHVADGIQVAEATRWSARYGLQGRIDLAVLGEREIRILELKTGGYESPEHERQLRCYALMWDGVAEQNDKTVQGELLYSKRGKRRTIQRRSHAAERRLVLGRNEIARLQNALCEKRLDDVPYYGQVMANCQDAPCRFRRDECAAQGRVVGPGPAAGDIDASASREDAPRSLDPALREAVRAYYWHFVSLLEREYRAESREMGGSLRIDELSEAVERRRAIAEAELTEIDDREQTVMFACDNPGVFHEGDAIVGYRGAIDDAPILSGWVRFSDTHRLLVSTGGVPAFAEAGSDGWTLVPRVLRIGHRDAHRALYRFVASQDARRLEKIVTPGRRVRSGQRELVLDASEGGDLLGEGDAMETGDLQGVALNAEQRVALARALEERDALLIQGPPGTGKTTVVAEIVRESVARGERVLVAAFTNTAVDTMLARVVDAGVHDVIRIGRAAKASYELRDALERAGRSTQAHFTRDMERTTASLERLRDRLAGTPVVAATTNACASSSIFDILTAVRGEQEPLFDVAVLDEAAQLTEPMALAAIHHARRFILVGDDYQLPPVVTAADARSRFARTPEQELLVDAGIGGLDRSLFERLKPWTPHVMLTTQYRMNRTVQEFASQAFYGGRLVPAATNADRHLALAGEPPEDAELRRRLAPDRPSVWVDVPGAERGNVNPVEVEEIARTAAAILERWDPAGSVRQHELIGIVAPYRAQCHAVRSALRAQLGGEVASRIEVDTVDRFQGREKEVMLVSFVRAEWNDFVFDPRRINVTLTRARSKVIVFGEAALGRRMIRAFEARGGRAVQQAASSPPN